MHGGVAMFVKSSIPFKFICKSPCDSEVEYLFIEISSVQSKILIGTVYRPNRSIAISSFVDVIEEISVPYDNILFADDFNSNLLRENSLSLRLSSLGLHSCNIFFPTHFTNTANTLLDLFFVNDMSKSSGPIFSKYDLIFLTYDFQFKKA